MKKYDHLALGVMIGMLMSVIAIVAFYFMKFSDQALTHYFYLLFRTKALFAPLLSLAGIPNLVIFYLFLNKEKYKTAKGLILATFMLVVFVMIIKLAL